MDKFDKKLQEELRASAPGITPEASRKFDAALPHKRRHYKGLVAAALAVVFLVMPNVNASFAQTLWDIPVIGEIFKVTSLYHYRDSNSDVKVPAVKERSKSATYINKTTKEWTTEALNAFKKDFGNSKSASFKIDYKVVTNNKYWFTLKVESLTTAADSGSKIYYYNIDKATGHVVNMNDLFVKNYNYKKVINAQILKVSNADKNGTYFKEGDDLGSYFKSINKNTPFYINDNHQLVIVFNQGEIGPMSSGTIEFKMNSNVLSKGLKSHVKTVIR
jgi:hypothetical protein